MSLISIVVPVYNNAASLPDLLARFQDLAAQDPANRYEFIFVDDGSFDDSYAVLQSLARREGRVRIVKLSRNFGSNAAIMAGLTQARGQAVAAIAADLQDPPELIAAMLDHWRAGAKVVLAARRGRDDGLLSNLLSDIFYALFRRFAIPSMPKRGFDFFLLDRQVCDQVNRIQEHNVYLMGLILWLGFQPVVVHYDRQRRERRYGRSMWTLRRKIKYFIDSFVAFSYFPVRAASLMGICLSVLGALYAVIILFLRLFYAIEVQGWASLMLVLLLVSGIQMLLLGILGEYLWRNLDETRKRPPFIIEEIIETPPEETE
ncbi:MAG: glycosyltransferase family 2 protein [Anaerolineales bacterium]